VELVDVHVDELVALRERVAEKLAPEDAQLLQQLIDSYVHVEKLVRMKETTIRRLRRLFGINTSEKTQAVVGTLPHTTAKNPESEPSANGNEGSSSATGGATGEKKKGHGRNGKSAYQGATRTTIPHPTLKPGDRCPLNCGGKVYPWSNNKSLVRIYGQSPIVAHIYDLETFRCNGCLEFFAAEAPAEIAAQKKYDESVAAIIAQLHYGLGTPFYRLERLQASAKVPLPAATQWEIISSYYPMLEPIFSTLVSYAANGELLHNDDTSVRILEFMGKRRAQKEAKGLLPKPERTGMYTTGIVGQHGPHKIALFYSGRDHAGENIAKVLAERQKGLGPPIQMSDGLSANVCHMFDVIQANCLSHGRRLWVDKIVSFPGECRHFLETLATVFFHEKQCKQMQLSPQERLAYHQQHSKPLLDELKTWMENLVQQKKIEPNSDLGDPIRYMLKRWDKLTLFLTVPGAPLENNVVERALKKSILQRKNSLFYKTTHGANVAGLFTTLIHTAELNDLDSLDYLTQVMRHPDHVAKCPDQWLPWTYKATVETLAS
jgi:transposase